MSCPKCNAREEVSLLDSGDDGAAEPQGPEAFDLESVLETARQALRVYPYDERLEIVGSPGRLLEEPIRTGDLVFETISGQGQRLVGVVELARGGDVSVLTRDSMYRPLHLARSDQRLAPEYTVMRLREPRETFEDWLEATPNDFFLPGVPTTSECSVLFHVGYPAYYKRLEQLITQTSAGDEIFMVGWSMDMSTKLSKNTIEFLLRAAVGRKARVRVLLSATSGTAPLNGDAVTKTRALGGEAFLDTQYRTTPFYSSFHQKAVYIRLRKESRLLLGGMDVSFGRVTPAGNSAWLDVQAEVVGRGAELGRNMLEERWASVTRTSPPAAFVPAKGADITFVQFVRTYPKPDANAAKQGRTYFPSGEFRTQELLRRACEKAEEFIYIEDQYFFGDKVNGAPPNGVPSLDDALAKAVKRGVELIVVTTRGEQAGEEWMPRKRRRDLMALLAVGKVSVLRFQSRYNPDVWNNFVHTKAWIFDDKFAVVGSANYNRSGMTFEGEFGIGVTSKAGADVVPGLRRKLWLAILNAPSAPGGFKEKDVQSWRLGRDALKGGRSPLEAYVGEVGSDARTVSADGDGS